MRLNLPYRLVLIALAFICIASGAFAAYLTSGLTAGTWSTVTSRSNDEYSIVKATKLNATTTSATIAIPANTLNTPRIFLYATASNDNGVSATIIQAPLNADAVSLDGSATVYTDAATNSTALGSVTTAAPLVSASLDTSTRYLKVVGTNISTTEVMDVRVEYRQPVKYRWYRQF